MSNEYIDIFLDGYVQNKMLIRKPKGFNPMTGEPEYELYVENGFDENTMQPKVVKVKQNGFDGMTGKPAYVVAEAASQPSTQPAAQSDPYSYTAPQSQAYGASQSQPYGASQSQPYGAPQSQPYGAPQSQPYTAPQSQPYGAPQSQPYGAPQGQPYGAPQTYPGGYSQGFGGAPYGAAPKKQSSLPMGLLIGIIAGGAALVALILVTVFVLVPNGVLLSKQNKVAMAAYQTLKKSTMGGVALEAGEILASDEISAEVAANASVVGYGASVEGTMSADRAAGKASVDAKVNVSGVINQSVEAYMDDSSVQLALPDMLDQVLIYDYTRNGGCVDEILRSATNGSSADLNDALSALNSMMKNSSKSSKGTIKAIKKAYGKLDTEKLDKKEFEIDGKDRKCAGYRITVTEKDVNDLIRNIAEVSNDATHDDLVKFARAIGNLTGDEIPVDELDFNQQYFDMDDVSIDVYLYKGQLAAVQYDNVSVEFRGGDTRTSNIAFLENGSELVIFSSEISKGKETGTISAQGMTMASYTYDKGDGDFDITITDEGSYRGVFLVDRGAIELEFSYGPASISAKVKDKAQIKKPKGDELIINDYSINELGAIIMGPIQNVLGPILNYL